MTSKESKLFERAAVFTDIHFGAKQNSKQHLDDCENFLDWFIQEAKDRNCETCMFLGDWHNNRANLNIATLNATHRAFKKLNDNFQKVYFITGNHDLFYRDKRDITSVVFAQDFPNFHLINEVFVQDDVAIIPWLVEDEWKNVRKIKCRYMFGHLELPKFKMNAMVEMPDHGGLRGEDLDKPEYVFSGHFHKRQVLKNIHYIGNPFGHNYSDAGDFDRGAMFLEWGGEPQYVNWDRGPKYMLINLKDLIDQAEEILDDTMHLRVTLDVDISYEEANLIRESFTEKYGVREMKLITPKEKHEEQTGIEIKFESVDQIVVSQLQSIESTTISNQRLIELYLDLEI